MSENVECMKHNETDEDLRIAQKFQLGYESAFDDFFRSYFPALCQFANTYLKDIEQSKDIVQESFVKLWEKHSEINSPYSIRSFLYKIVRNKCIDVLRRKKVKDKGYEEFKYLNAHWSQEEINEIIHWETIRKIYCEISILPPKMQQVFRMYYLEGKKYQEIAKEMKISYHTVRHHKTRALELLKGRILIIFNLIAILENVHS